MAVIIKTAQAVAQEHIAHTHMGKPVSSTETQSEEGQPVSVVEQANLFHLMLRKGLTLNLGNFNSTKFEISISVPVAVAPDAPDHIKSAKLNQAMLFADTYVNEKMEMLAEQANSAKNGE